MGNLPTQVQAQVISLLKIFVIYYYFFNLAIISIFYKILFLHVSLRVNLVYLDLLTKYLDNLT